MGWKNKAPRGEVVLCKNCKISLDRQLNTSKSLPKDVSFPLMKIC